MKNIVGRKFLVICVSLAVLALLGAAYALSFLISQLGAFLLLVALCYFLTAFITKILVFPGSYKFWLRMIESSFASELSEQAIGKLTQLSQFLDDLLTHSLVSCNENLKLTQKLISTLIINYRTIEDIQPNQIIFLASLEDLKKALLDLWVTTGDQCVNMWDAMEDHEISHEPLDTTSLSICKKKCSIVIQHLIDNSNRSIFRGGFLIGSLAYMQADLSRRFRSEQFWLMGEDNVKIDCTFISGVASDSTSPVIIFCNPNATYYEFLYFQTDWIEFYIGAGVNLVLWNYRGYGRSQGSPSLLKSQSDGMSLVRYIRETKRNCKLGVHGESLGGSVASYLARSGLTDFLFADRTFASLGKVARYNFGKFAEFAFKATGPKDYNAVQDFLAVNCFKIVSCDCNDLMINKLGSLKSGIAVEYFNQHEWIFSIQDLEKLWKILKNLQISAKFGKSSHLEKKIIRKGVIEDSSLKMNLLLHLQEIVEKVDAGGESFLDLFVDCTVENVKTWVSVLGIWGSTPYIYSNQCYNKQQCAYEKLAQAVVDLTEFIEEFSMSINGEVQKTLESIREILLFFVKCKDWISTLEVDHEIVGKLLPLTCGHNGAFNSLERYMYEQHLQSIGFF